MINSPSTRAQSARDYSEAKPLFADLAQRDQPMRPTRPLEPHWVELIEAATD